jgi:HAD superfamily hydrolase (TIGR01509 family)
VVRWGKKARGIIWDLDGVLIDSELLHIRAERETLREFGITLTTPIAKQYFGVKLTDYFKDIARRFGPDIPATLMIRKHLDTLKKYYGEIFPLAPHTVEVLNALKNQYPMGIATSRERELAQIVLERFSLFPFFETVVYGDDVEKGKPHPEAFIKAAGLMKMDASSIAVVEDSISGYIAGQKAGMHVSALKAAHNHDLDFSQADFTVEDLREIPPLLKKIVWKPD